MKIRRKKRPRYKIGEYPKKGTPEYEQLTPQERKRAGLVPAWKKGQSGNPLGRKPGSGSIVTCLRRALSGPSFNARKYDTLAQELASVMTRKARKGHAGFMAMILDKAESKLLTREDIDMLIERIYGMFLQYVEDENIRAKLAIAVTALKSEEN